MTFIHKGAMILAGVLLVYILSIGPALRFLEMSPTLALAQERACKFNVFYAPILWISERGRSESALDLYESFWMPDQPGEWRFTP